MSRRLSRREVLLSATFAATGVGAGLLGARTGGRTPSAVPPPPASPPAGVSRVPVAVASGSPSGLAILTAGLAARTTRPCRIAFAGSSTTAGSGATSPERSYVGVLVSALQAEHPSGTGQESTVLGSSTADFGRPADTPGVHGYNVGRSGSRAATYLDPAAVGAIAALGPSAVVHMVGSNDFAAGVPPEQYRAALAQQLDAFRAVSTAPCVHVLVHSYQRTDRPTYGHPWAAYRGALDAVATDRDVVVLDISGPYRAAQVPGEDPLQLISADRVHQTDRGHAFMADVIRSALTVRG